MRSHWRAMPCLERAATRTEVLTRRFGGLGQMACAAAILTTLSCLAAGCGAPPDSQDEVPTTTSSALKNGTLVDGSSKWNGVVLLYIYNFDLGDWEVCTGAITSQTTIVTAAHCLAGTFDNPADSSGYLYVEVVRETSSGSYELLNAPATPAFGKYNPAWDITAKHDVAVITVQSPLWNITRADATYLAKSAPSGSTMWALGYGFYGEGLRDDQGRAGQVTPTYFDSQYSFTASTSQPWTCTGDSGGPLKMVSGSHWMEFGVASQTDHADGEACGRTGRWSTTMDNLAWLEYAIGTDKCTELLTFVTCW